MHLFYGLANYFILIHFRYASLYFCCAIEKDDNELLTLEIIHRYVELLDKYFGSVSLIWIYGICLEIMRPEISTATQEIVNHAETSSVMKTAVKLVQGL